MHLVSHSFPLLRTLLEPIFWNALLVSLNVLCSNCSQQSAEGNNFLDRVITHDEEKWCFQNYPKIKYQSMQASVSLRPKNEHMREQGYFYFFDHKDIVHTLLNDIKHWPAKQHFYLKYWQGYMKLFVSMDLNSVLMLGSCIMTVSLLMTLSMSRSFLTAKLIKKLDHSPYSPDLASCNFWWFQKLKTALKGDKISRHCRHLVTCENHPKEYSTTQVLQMFLQQKHRFIKCISAQGRYFWGDRNYYCVGK